MCGIAGLINFNGDEVLDAKVLGAMLEAISHRGPDARGVAIYENAALGNNRLSVIDVEGGGQPITNEDGTVVVVYNGEIYNYRELRSELIRKGHEFQTRTDTEVLVHLYEEEGESFVRRLNGMFAFALYDRSRDKVLIARDRFGVKPMFYMRCGATLCFASEIKALRVVPGFDTTLSPEGMSLAMGLFFLAEPWTIYRNVRRLRQGHYLRADRDGIAMVEYADWMLDKKIRIGRADAARETARLLSQSVQRQMVADVPVGVLLSGGLDSRSIYYLATRSSPATEAFTITFGEREFDEGDLASSWVHALGGRHHAMLFAEDDLCADYEQRQTHLDEPYALWCNVASARLARYIRDQGCKVVLGGDGGDELFLGYPTIQAAWAARYYQRIPGILRRRVIEPLVSALPAGRDRLPLAFMAQSFVGAFDPDIFRMFFGFKEVLRYREWVHLLTPEANAWLREVDPFMAHAQYIPAVRNLSLIDALSYMDFKVFLPGACLYGSDNAYMASSVELRVPFLDNDLADFAGTLPTDVRFELFETKPVLRSALGRYLIADGQGGIAAGIKRYRKAGFEVPGSAWLRRGRFQILIKNILSRARVERAGFFRPAAVQRILDEQLAGLRNNERALQAICSIQLFLERNGGRVRA